MASMNQHAVAAELVLRDALSGVDSSEYGVTAFGLEHGFVGVSSSEADDGSYVVDYWEPDAETEMPTARFRAVVGITLVPIDDEGQGS
jgi:hypothetical protein